MMDSDFSENDAENGELAKPKEDSTDIDALSHQQPDDADDAVVADDAGDAENPRIENQLGVSDAKAGVDFDVLELTNGDSPSLDGHSLEPSTASSSVNTVNSPVDPVAVFPADASHSESNAESPMEIERQQKSGSQSSPPESISPHGIERTADFRAADKWTFAIDSSMSSNSTVETPAIFAPDAPAEITAVPPTSIPGDVSRITTGSRFSESAETIALPAAQPASGFAGLRHSDADMGPHIASADANDEAISELLRHNWDKGIPRSDDRPPEEAVGFRMPPLLLEVSRTDYQSRIEKIEEAAAARLNRIIDERIEDAISEREFMHAAEMRALFR